MFDVSTHIEKLEWLREWVDIRIENWFLLRLLQDVYENTGMIMLVEPTNESSLTFPEYCELKGGLKAAINNILNK